MTNKDMEVQTKMMQYRTLPHGEEQISILGRIMLPVLMVGLQTLKLSSGRLIGSYPH